ncbi:hypothetical protein Poly21_07190 [Allorhodopirellula heiligendammensis]|uniref:Transmembrane protein n=1 Tax=Allorhodopirellula heiligendammensis TaxID=2714739 RepID=A0A5C6C3A1_9BACT|nr:hypothetical protein Poly21_07190 [Allorhodopirellula heiligendammensis]
MAPNAATQRARRGPALYIVGLGFLGGVGSIPFLALQNPIGFVVVLTGCILGGLVYRIRSRDWPHDPTIRQKQILYSALAVALPPAVLFLFAGPNGQGPAIVMIGLIVGVSVACGIFISGTRRLNIPLKAAQ